MSPAELRARAKTLRADAAQCVRDAEQLEAADMSARRVAASREAREAKAATMCRPVWHPEGLDGVYVVVAIENGCFMVRNLLAMGGTDTPHPYRTRDGRYAGSPWVTVADTVRRARLDHVATMLAWREWCASRKADA